MPPLSARKLLVIEFWGLGDLTFATPLLEQAQTKWEVTLAAKEHARPLLGPTFPELLFETYEAPWSAYTGKYNLATWDWRRLGRLIRQLRRRRFDAAVSVRSDPRDHLLMQLAGVRRRYGFPSKGSDVFLTDPLPRSAAKQHKVDDWRTLGRALGLAKMQETEPRLDHPAYFSPRVDALFHNAPAPVLCLHPGARIPVRRWPVAHFARLIALLRTRFRFHLLLIPDPDGFGAELAPLSDTVLPKLNVGELVDVLGRVDLLICNDSGPGHLAASCGRPAIAVFGPTDPDWFRPWGSNQKIILRDLCPWRPCFDYCKFDESHCLTKLLPERVWPEIRDHILRLVRGGILPRALELETWVPAAALDLS